MGTGTTTTGTVVSTTTTTLPDYRPADKKICTPKIAEGGPCLNEQECRSGLVCVAKKNKKKSGRDLQKKKNKKKDVDERLGTCLATVPEGSACWGNNHCSS